MKKEISTAELKKKLSSMEQKELVNLVCNMYKNSEDAERILNLELLGEAYSEKLLEQYKEKLYDTFFTTRYKQMGFSLATAKSILSEFKKFNTEEEYRLDIQLYYVECAVKFSNTFGDIDMKFYDSICSTYTRVTEGITKQNSAELFRKYQKRLEGVVNDTGAFGWGVQDYVSDAYDEIPWIFEEDNEV